MSKNIKNDRSDCFIYNFNHREDSFYMAQVVFNDGKLEKVEIETDIKGYYLMIVNVEYDIENGVPYNPNMLYSDLRLLVQCERRSEKNFNIALEKMEKVARESVEIMEADKEYFRNIAEENGIEDVNEMIDKIMKMMKDDEGLETEKNELMAIKEQVNKNDKNKKKEKKERKITFKDVAGMEDAKEVFLDVIDQLKNPEKYEHFDIEPIKSLLLYGLPGTGKTFIANAFANEIDANFVKINMGDLSSKYQGETGKNIKKVFDDVRKSDKFTVIFWDEIDAVANRRGADENSKEKNATLNVLLTEMSSEDNNNIFMVFATNFIELLDSAFLRSGRCDIKIEIPLPCMETRLQILELNTKRKPLGKDVDLKEIAKKMENTNCADVALLCSQSARCALKKDKMEINQEDFMEMLDKMKMKKEKEKAKQIGFSL